MDGIYPSRAIFVGPKHAPANDREKNMTKAREGTKRDIETLFGALQGRFNVLRHETFEWSNERIILISQVCVALHNMIIDMDMNVELKYEADEHGDPISIIEEFSSKAQQGIDKEEEGHEGNELMTTSNLSLIALLEQHEFFSNNIITRMFQRF